MFNTLEYDGDDYYTYKVSKGSVEHCFVVHVTDLTSHSCEKQFTVELLPTSRGYLDIYEEGKLVSTTDKLITFQKFLNLSK